MGKYVLFKKDHLKMELDTQTQIPCDRVINTAVASVIASNGVRIRFYVNDEEKQIVEPLPLIEKYLKQKAQNLALAQIVTSGYECGIATQVAPADALDMNKVQVVAAYYEAKRAAR